ncbi:hypothetical protein CEXT_161681 [Caerostris extrusa]|uniref:Uncharacterized protein n=1 Tax=Caerostris extrusa TaxID=172846 RepID=A0AAV4XXI2_CAEEX|nr:hypothetical protein CEXT_161681 [Caerostris extrusa]
MPHISQQKGGNISYIFLIAARGVDLSSRCRYPYNPMMRNEEEPISYIIVVVLAKPWPLGSPYAYHIYPTESRAHDLLYKGGHQFHVCILHTNPLMENERRTCFLLT